MGGYRRLIGLVVALIAGLLPVGLLPSPAGAAGNGSIEGTITDSAGVGIAGASVELLGPDPQLSTTGADGAYSFGALTPGDHTVVASAAGFVTAALPVFAVDGSVTPGNLVLFRPASLSGTVMDLTGAPIAGATVTVTPPFSPPPDPVPTATTSADGSWSIGGLAQGSYQVVVSAPGFSTGGFPGFPFAAEGIDTPGIDVFLGRSGGLTGTVTGTDGAPVADAFVTVSGSVFASTSTAIDGTFAFGDLREGPYTIDVSRPGFRPRSTFATVVGGAVVVADVQLEATARIAGSVLDGGGLGVGFATVSAIDAFGLTAATAFTDPAGAFTLEVAAGDYKVIVFDVQGGRQGSASVVAVAGQTTDVTVTLPALDTLVTGTVTDDLGQPIAGASVTIGAVTALSELDGTFRIAGLAPGFYGVTVVAAAGFSTFSTFVSVANGVPADVPVQLTRATSIRGRVVDELGVPVVGAGVSAFGSSGFASGTTGADGGYVLEVTPGSFQVSASAAGHRPGPAVFVTAVAGEQTVAADLVLSRVGQVIGRVVDASGGPVPFAIVSWRPTSSFQFASASTGFDGSFVLADISGSGRIVVTPSGGPAQFFDADGVPGADEIVVPNGATVDAGVHVLIAGGSVSGTVTGPDGPVAGVVVQAVNQDGLATFPFPSAFTAADGTYRIDGLAPGGYVVSFSPPTPDLLGEWWNDRFVEQPVGDGLVSVLEGVETTAIDAVLDRPSTMTGRVTDTAGSPVAGATVLVVRGDGMSSSIGTTDADGVYRVGGLAPVESFVLVSPVDPVFLQSGEVRGIVVPRGGTVAQDVVLQPAGAIDAFDEFGQPAFGQMVVCRQPAVPVGGQFSPGCSDPSAVVGGRPFGSTTHGLPAGDFNVALGRFTGLGVALSPVAPVTIVAGTTAACRFGFGASPSSCGGEVDEIAPIVTCPSVPVFVLHETGAVVTATVDDDGVVSNVSAPVGTSVPGSNTVTLSASDAAGNVGSATCEYAVHYRFVGFSAPIRDGQVHRVEAGEVVRLAWRLTDAAGSPVTDAASFAGFVTAAHACGSQRPVRLEGDGESVGFRSLNQGRYRYGWKVPRAARNSCVTATVTLADGTSHSAEFTVRG